MTLCYRGYRQHWLLYFTAVTLATDIIVDFVTVVSIVPWLLWLREWQCVTLRTFSLCFLLT